MQCNAKLEKTGLAILNFSAQMQPKCYTAHILQCSNVTSGQPLQVPNHASLPLSTSRAAQKTCSFSTAARECGKVLFPDGKMTSLVIFAQRPICETEQRENPDQLHNASYVSFRQGCFHYRKPVFPVPEIAMITSTLTRPSFGIRQTACDCHQQSAEPDHDVLNKNW